METIEALFASFGGPANIGRAIGVSTEHAGAMKRRKSIPVDYWPALIQAARERGLHDLTYETLVMMHTDSVLARSA